MKSVKVSLKAQKSLKSLKSALNEAGDLLKRAPQGATFKVEDIYLPLNHLFDHATKRAFETVVKNTVIERECKAVSTLKVTVIDEVRYFGAQAVGERKIFDAAQKVANTINFYANKGFVTGALAKLILLPLATEPFQLERYLVLSYVALSPEGLEYLKNNPTKLEFQVGTLPVNSDDV